MEELNLWGAELGECYYYLDECLDVVEEVESGDYKDNILWTVGNYFQTYGEAEKASESIKECFKIIHSKRQYE